jgi:HsdM N-terminal domain
VPEFELTPAAPPPPARRGRPRKTAGEADAVVAAAGGGGAKGGRRGSGGAAPLGFEATLWAAADALRNNMDAAEYKHVVLGLIFLKYISDAFEAQHAELAAQAAAGEGADPEDPDEYRAASIFWVPKEARWAHLKASAPQPEIGRLVDDAMTAIEHERAHEGRTRIAGSVAVENEGDVGDAAPRLQEVASKHPGRARHADNPWPDAPTAGQSASCLDGLAGGEKSSKMQFVGTRETVDLESGT